MRHPPGQTLRHVASGDFKTSACAGKGRSASPSTLWASTRNAAASRTIEASRPVGGRISEILGRLAESTRGVFGKDKSATRKEKETLTMCPVCIANMAVAAAGATSGGGLTIF